MRAALVLAGLLLTAPALAQEPPPPTAHHQRSLISIAGEGTVSAAPDLAVLSSGVISEAKTAREALTANTSAMEKVIASFKSAGIADKDIATSGFSVQPRYVYEENKPPRVTGYQVSNGVTIKVRDLSKLGGVLDAAVTEGSNQINGLSFDVAEPDALLDEARKKAVADARRKAEIYTAAAGVKLGPVVGISEQTGGFPPPPRPMMMRAEMAKASADVPVERGEQEMKVSVNVTWEIVE